MAGAFEQLHNGNPVSLDAVQPRVYSGSLWRSRAVEAFPVERYREISSDPISGRLLTLHLLDPSAYNFRPAGCKSTHDVLRFCHEKAIEAMFALNDSELERGLQCSKKLLTPVPINLQVLDLGGGLAISQSIGTGSEAVGDCVQAVPGPLARGVSSRSELDPRDAC